MSERFRELCEEMAELHDLKNADYASFGPENGNFERVAQICAIYPKMNNADPRIINIVYMLKQLDATIWMITNGYDGGVESIDKRLRDVAMYASINRIINEEINNGK